MSYVIGVDIGGSHITAAMVDARAGHVLDESRSRKLVNPNESADKITRNWCSVIEAAAAVRLTNSLKIGISMPGPFDYEEGICLIKEQDKFRSLYGINLKHKLALTMKMPPSNIRFINDAASFLQGEVLYGAATGASNVLGFTLGTGLGSAVHTKEITVDADLWNTPFRGEIAEAFLSTSWFLKKYKSLTGKEIAGVKELMEVAADKEREKIFAEFSENLALFLGPQLKKWPIEKIVFGGNISNTEAYFFPLLKQRLAEAGYGGEVSRGLLFEDAALLGAAGCWNQDGKDRLIQSEALPALSK